MKIRRILTIGVFKVNTIYTQDLGTTIAETGNLWNGLNRRCGEETSGGDWIAKLGETSTKRNKRAKSVRGRRSQADEHTSA